MCLRQYAIACQLLLMPASASAQVAAGQRQLAGVELYEAQERLQSEQVCL